MTKTYPSVETAVQERDALVETDEDLAMEHYCESRDQAVGEIMHNLYHDYRIPWLASQIRGGKLQQGENISSEMARYTAMLDVAESLVTTIKLEMDLLEKHNILSRGE